MHTDCSSTDFRRVTFPSRDVTISGLPSLAAVSWLTTLYISLNGMAPDYLTDICIFEILTERRRPAAPRSASTSTLRLLQSRRTPSTKFADPTFSAAAPTKTKSLPDHIENENVLDYMFDFRKLLRGILRGCIFHGFLSCGVKKINYIIVIIIN